jgi:D-beta-D-heptose 7-phosphate kinase/D-beta-D-heptose 1-phosphate adenosyltransferase
MRPKLQKRSVLKLAGRIILHKHGFHTRDSFQELFLTVQRIMTKKRALEIIANFSKAGVLVVGDVMVDHFIWGNVSRISPEAPVPVVDVQKDSIMLGGCANVLNNIYAMGGKVYVAGVIGADNVGKKLLKELRERKIETKGVVVEKGRPTTLKTRIVAHGQQMVFRQGKQKAYSKIQHR